MKKLIYRLIALTMLAIACRNLHAADSTKEASSSRYAQLAVVSSIISAGSALYALTNPSFAYHDAVQYAAEQNMLMEQDNAQQYATLICGIFGRLSYSAQIAAITGAIGLTLSIGVIAYHSLALCGNAARLPWTDKSDQKNKRWNAIKKNLKSFALGTAAVGITCIAASALNAGQAYVTEHHWPALFSAKLKGRFTSWAQSIEQYAYSKMGKSQE